MIFDILNSFYIFVLWYFVLVLLRLYKSLPSNLYLTFGNQWQTKSKLQRTLPLLVLILFVFYTLNPNTINTHFNKHNLTPSFH